VEFGVPGPVSVRVDGKELALGGPKQRALLAILLLARSGRVSRDRLIDGLWGERAPPSSEHSLDTYVSRLRQVLGPGRITRSAGGYSLRVEPGELDLDRFEELVRQAMQERADDPARAAATLSGALALWRGPPLADLLDEPFAGEESRRLEETRLAALEERIEADLAAGAGGELVPELDALVRENPLDERLIASLMLALYRAGRQTAALELYRSARRRLAEELGIEAGPRLGQLERAILEHDPGLGTVATAPAPPRRRGRRRWLVAGAVGALIAALLGITAALRQGTSRDVVLLSAKSNGLLGVDPASGRPQMAAPLQGAPAALVSGGGSVWAADTDHNAIVRLRSRTGEVADRIPLAAQPGDLAAGGGSLWVAMTAGDTIDRIDMSTDKVTQTMHLGVAPSALLFRNGSLWVGDPEDKALLRLRPDSRGVTQTETVDVAPSAIAEDHGLLWVAGYDAATVVAFNPRTRRLAGRISVGQGPDALVPAAGSLWVANLLDGTVSRVDTVHQKVAETVATGSSPTSLAAAAGSVWVANRYSGTVTRIDAGSGKVVSGTHVGGLPTGLAVAAAGGRPTLWVGAEASGRNRGGTLVLLDSGRFGSLDAQIENNTPPAQFMGLVNDGLVAYDHTAGPDGLNLVPDLALAIPEAVDAGRTYAFVLRPGIRYSTGRVVEASDFARGMRRLFAVHSPAAGFFADVGVVADDGSRTVTFHLKKPDPDFLFKLALGFVIPVLPGTPDHDIGNHPIPGTGPYRFAKVGPRSIVAVRNPRFREWSHAAQPDGLPDRIEWRFGGTPGSETAAVEAGRGDWTGDFPSNLAKVDRSHPSLVHSNVFPTPFFLQVNTNRPPFDDVRVRRALNYAVDRAKVVRLYGGSLTNAPACQVFPPGLVGYKRYCPYTVNPNRSGLWTAPDLGEARKLVRLSHTSGERVSIWDVSDSGAAEPVVPYVARLLRSLGYRPTVRVLTSDQFNRTSPSERTTAQLIPVVFGPDYPLPAELYSYFLACDGSYNPHDVCNPGLDRQAQRAEQARSDSPTRSAHLWEQIDRELVDQAIWVPLTSQRIVDIVSKRLRNYEFSPVYHFLPAQASLRGPPPP
jgi:ABC-type transport system substrate-binding protein/DNA-binding SARP family transcriptional activator